VLGAGLTTPLHAAFVPHGHDGHGFAFEVFPMRRLVLLAAALAGLLAALPAQAQPRLFAPHPTAQQIISGHGHQGYQGHYRYNAYAQPASQFARQVVQVETREAPGTIIVDTGRHFLYLVLGDGQALRYGIGVARSGFEWRGTHRVTRKAEWPGWTPPPEMRRRQPGLPAHMPGGPDNPLGARALYLGSTLYRIHGTNEPWTIGQNVSSGCIRMLNEDVIDLYQRVHLNAKVVVL
jgi:lipoprotein-anchoring transpeptidase ErfK/SrfK